MARRSALTDSRADAAARLTSTAAAGVSPPSSRESASSIRPTPDQLLDRPVVQVLGHPPPLLLLREHEGRGQGPPLVLLAPQVGQQAGVGERDGGLVGQPSETLRVVPVEGIAGEAGERDGADGLVAPVGRRHGDRHLAHPPQRAALGRLDGQPLRRREHLAARAVMRRHRHVARRVAQDEHRRIGPDQPAGLGHDGAVGVGLVQRRGPPPAPPR